jgi:anti-sigma regulatory factor (Ser/Thr protein kinase)
MPPPTTLVEKRWNSHPSNVHCAREAVRHALRNLADPLLIDLIELAIGEACANAVEHGSPHGERSEFLLRCLFSDETHLVFEVEDEGADFAVSDLPLHTIPDLYSEGGRGLFLINQIMDHVAIHRTEIGLSVRMTKAVPVG